MRSCLLKSPCLFSLQNSGAKYVGNKTQGDFTISQFASAMHWQKTAEDSAESLVYYVSYSFGTPQHFAKGSDLVF